MSALLPFLILERPCDQALSWINERLAYEDLRTQQTFDLQVARLVRSADIPTSIWMR